MAEIITKATAGSAQQLGDEEFKLVVGAWTETLGGFVPESRLNDCYLHAARFRNSSFPMTATDMCSAWTQIQAAERSMPAIGTYDWDRARKVCAKCNNTGAVLFVKRDETIGRDYTYAKPCDHV